VVAAALGLPTNRDAGEEGPKALDEIMNAPTDTKLVALTVNGYRENAIRAVQLGAFDYHLKPIQLNELKVVLQRAGYLKALEAESEKSLRTRETTTRFEDILGNAPAMREIFGIVTRVAKTDATVLIQGESGTGKELLAMAIHSNGARRNQAFVAINCGAIPETLL